MESRDCNEIFYFSDPIPLLMSGGGHYGLTEIKDVRVSREFVGLGEAVSQSKTKEAGADCLTRKHQETVLATCGCAPFSLSSHYGTQAGVDVCSPSSLDCVGRVAVPDGECLEQCQGPIMGVERLDSLSNEEGLQRYISDYEKYKYPQIENLTFPIGMKGESNRRSEHPSFHYFKNWSLRAN